MDTINAPSYETILQVVSSWPVDKRLILIQDVLKTVVPPTEAPRPRRRTLAQARGLLATDRPPPSDEEVEQWLEEHRMEKYG